MIDPITTTTLGNLAVDVLKIWLPAAGALFGVFKVINWIKNKFTSIDDNVIELKKSVEASIGGLRNDITTQTSAITTALSEQRQDFRTFYAPTLLMMQQQTAQFQNNQFAPARAKRSVRRKPAVKKKSTKA